MRALIAAVTLIGMIRHTQPLRLKAHRPPARRLLECLEGDTKKRRYCFLLPLWISLALGGCGSTSNDPAAPVMPPPTVKVVKVQLKEVALFDEYPARIDAVETVDVRARVDGYLEKVNFKAGEVVKKGDLLFVIDPRPFRVQLSHAEARLQEIKARLELARNNLMRAERLFKAKAISEEEYDARSKSVDESEGALQAAKAEVDAARLNLEFTEVRAPIAGRIGRELVTAGNLVKGGGADATRLTFIVSTDPVYVYADIDERAALKYRRLAATLCAPARNETAPGCLPAELALADETGFPHRGHVDYLAPRLDPATGTLSLRAIFANTDGLLAPGLFARLRIPSGAPVQALLLPDRAVMQDLARAFVWVVNAEGKVERRPVVTGSLSDGLRIIRDGLKPDEWVVVEGVQKLKPGMSIKAEHATPEA